MSILYHGDCLELLKEVPNRSVDLIFCDLPYGQTANWWDVKIDLQKLWKEILRVKKKRTPVFFTTTTKFGVEIIQSAPKSCPFHFDLVWEKSSPSGFLTSKKIPLKSHEMIYAFYKVNPMYDISSHQPKYKEEDYDGETHNECNYGSIKTKYRSKGDNSGPRYDPPLPRSVLKIGSTKKNHSTEKPVELMEWILKYFSKEGDTILDPTMGSGSMGVACKHMGRNFIGIEKDDTFYNTAVNRLENN